MASKNMKTGGQRGQKKYEMIEREAEEVRQRVKLMKKYKLDWP